MILKIQIPLQTNRDSRQALVYNEDKSVLFECDEDIVKPLFGEGEYKIFVDGYIDDKGILQIDDTGLWEDW